MRVPLLVEYFQRLPERQEGEAPQTWAVRLQEGLATFQQQAGARYGEGTLQRLLNDANVDCRRAATMALGLVGSLESNPCLAARLHDSDAQVRRLAADALWATWFRSASTDHARELQRLMRQRDPQQALQGYEALIKKAPEFAEAYNQRAILHFRLQDYPKSIADCEVVLKLNPFHFGAQAGIGQCYLKLRKHRAALKAFGNALKLNPNLDGVEEAIRNLEESLGGEGKKEDK